MTRTSVSKSPVTEFYVTARYFSYTLASVIRRETDSDCDLPFHSLTRILYGSECNGLVNDFALGVTTVILGAGPAFPHLPFEGHPHGWQCQRKAGPAPQKHATRPSARTARRLHHSDGSARGVALASIRRRRAFRPCFDRRGNGAGRRCCRRGQTRDRPLRKTIQRPAGWRRE
jgi:hypothetical protein